MINGELWNLSAASNRQIKVTTNQEINGGRSQLTVHSMASLLRAMEFGHAA